VFGKGSVTYADGKLYCRAEGSGEVALVEANPKEFVELGRFTPPDRTSSEAWTQPVVANGKLYIRDQDTLFAYNVKAAGS
jgi:outer membrane protein assembly factor BamB